MLHSSDLEFLMEAHSGIAAKIIQEAGIALFFFFFFLRWGDITFINSMKTSFMWVVSIAQPIFTCSKLTIELLEGVKYVQS